MSDLDMAQQALEGMIMTDVKIQNIERRNSPLAHMCKTTVGGACLFNGTWGNFEIVFQGGIPLQVDGTRIEQKI